MAVANVPADGRFFKVVWAVNQSGQMPAKKFFDKKLSKDQRAKMTALFRRLANHGVIVNLQQFRPLGDGLFEFKDFQVRFLGAFGPGRREFSVALGLKKKKDRHDQKDLKRVRRVLNEYFSQRR